jgi:hypothetical protein
MRQHVVPKCWCAVFMDTWRQVTGAHKLYGYLASGYRDTQTLWILGVRLQGHTNFMDTWRQVTGAHKLYGYLASGYRDTQTLWILGVRLQGHTDLSRSTQLEKLLLR